jgi:hypothetical protein
MAVWSWIFFSQMRFWHVIAPAALSKWAEEQGFRIERMSVQVLPFGPYVWFAGPFRLVYRVTVSDQDFHKLSGWVRLGTTLWPCMSVETCPIEVQWDR